MPRLVPKEQKQTIEFLYKVRGWGSGDITDELKKLFGDNAASEATVVRELRRLRQDKQAEDRWRGQKMFPFTPWSIAMLDDFDDDSVAIISQVLTEALTFDNTIPSKTSIAQAQWLVRLRKAYPLQPAIIIWYAAYRVEFDEYVDRALALETKSDYRHIERALQFQPWRGNAELSLFEEICAKEKIGFDKNWWKSHMELFQKACSSTIHDKNKREE